MQRNRDLRECKSLASIIFIIIRIRSNGCDDDKYLRTIPRQRLQSVLQGYLNFTHSRCTTKLNRSETSHEILVYAFYLTLKVVLQTPVQRFAEISAFQSRFFQSTVASHSALESSSGTSRVSARLILSVFNCPRRYRSITFP